MVSAEGRKPRLVVDNTVCGTNDACTINESYSLPMLSSVRHSFPMREFTGTASAFSIDIEAAHKTVRVREQDRGLLGLRTELPGQPAKCYFYKVCPFGAVFSALWFARVGAFLVRVLHMLIWIRHMLGMYVDDLIGSTDEQAVHMVATVTLAFCDIFGFPISWRKVQIGHSIDWIGWSFHFRAGAVSVPVSMGIQRLLSSERILKQDLHPVIGLLQWLCQLYPASRPWMCSLYSDLHTPLGTNYSIAHGDWPELIHHLAPDLHFISSPRGTAISKGAKLLSVRHKQISSLADIKLVPVTERRIWIRVADPANSSSSFHTRAAACFATGFAGHRTHRRWSPCRTHSFSRPQRQQTPWPSRIILLLAVSWKFQTRAFFGSAKNGQCETFPSRGWNSPTRRNHTLLPLRPWHRLLSFMY